MAENTSKTALIVVDVQRAATNKEDRLKFGYNRCGDCIMNINRLIAYGQRMGWDIIYVAHSTPWYYPIHAAFTGFMFMKGSANVRFDERLQVIGSNRFEKTVGSALTNGKLKKLLKKNGIEKVMVCGFAADTCVSSTARSALARGYKVTVVSDSCIARTDEKAKTAFEKLLAEDIEIETTSNIVLR
ncbi:MAG: isochorismatase family cysteine hydrolase [Candidatus Firestonebacteria bacterium]